MTFMCYVPKSYLITVLIYFVIYRSYHPPTFLQHCSNQTQDSSKELKQRVESIQNCAKTVHLALNLEADMPRLLSPWWQFLHHAHDSLCRWQLERNRCQHCLPLATKTPLIIQDIKQSLRLQWQTLLALIKYCTVVSAKEAKRQNIWQCTGNSYSE